ncbi:non-homologous end-joining DNA ligase [Nocardioides sp.]|uniref:non-homologous end-joining DNA ligase n=1 Tax=Nocardioides sp. TaxID=35761 RepID=UPI0035197ED9
MNPAGRVLRPMLATKADHVPPGGEWWHEVKWDGMRILADAVPGADRVRLTSRAGNDVTVSWPEVAQPPHSGGRDLLVDGEIIALNDAGRPDFRALQERMHVRSAAAAARGRVRRPVTFMAFDLLRLDGRWLLEEPLERRRTLLEDALAGTSWQTPDPFDDGAMLLEATAVQGLEGIVSKRRDSRYRPGERSPDWLKRAHRHRASLVVGGWRAQEGSQDRLAALLVGEPTPEGLRYRGRVGSGIGPRQSRQLRALVADLARPASPFVDDVPRIDARGTHWLEPLLVVEVDSHRVGGGDYDRLRQPSFVGVRPDLDPAALGRDDDA